MVDTGASDSSCPYYVGDLIDQLEPVPCNNQNFMNDHKLSSECLIHQGSATVDALANL